MPENTVTVSKMKPSSQQVILATDASKIASWHLPPSLLLHTHVLVSAIAENPLNHEKDGSPMKVASQQELVRRSDDILYSTVQPGCTLSFAFLHRILIFCIKLYTCTFKNVLSKTNSQLLTERGRGWPDIFS